MLFGRGQDVVFLRNVPTPSQEVFTYFEDTKVLRTAKPEEGPSTLVASGPSPVWKSEIEQY